MYNIIILFDAIEDASFTLDNSKKPIFEKMITRSLYGNINASRNSA